MGVIVSVPCYRKVKQITRKILLGAAMQKSLVTFHRGEKGSRLTTDNGRVREVKTESTD